MIRPARKDEIRARIRETLSLLTAGFGPGYSAEEIRFALEVYAEEAARLRESA